MPAALSAAANTAVAEAAVIINGCYTYLFTSKISNYSSSWINKVSSFFHLLYVTSLKVIYSRNGEYTEEEGTYLAFLSIRE